MPYNHPCEADENKAFIKACFILGGLALVIELLVKVITGYSLIGIIWEMFWGAPWMSS